MPIRPENRKRYPADWKLRSRFVRYYRAKNRCEWCGAENGKPHPKTGSKVVLTTAHVYDHRPEAASLLNLAAPCLPPPHSPQTVKAKYKAGIVTNLTTSRIFSASPRRIAWGFFNVV